MIQFDAHRKRRVIYNDDSDQQYTTFINTDIENEEDFLEARTTPVFDTQVDTYVWCVGNGCDPPWGGEEVRSFLGTSARAADVITEACHAHDLEVWGSLRMNDIHDWYSSDSLEQTNDPLKAQHPEYLIAPQSVLELPKELELERSLWTAFNFAREEVREYRLSFIERNASAHDFDGYELDFQRMPWYFPLGEERVHAAQMTELVREARLRLNAVGSRRGKPYIMAVHVMDSIETSLEVGLDVETWLAEGLIDVLVVGMGYLPYSVRLDQWLALGRQYHVPVYPSVNTNTYAGWYQELFKRDEAWHEAIRASSDYYWQQGVDGIYLFNLFCQAEEEGGKLPKKSVYAPLKEIGGSQTLARKDKLYCIQSVTAGGGYYGCERTALPIALETIERALPLYIGPDACESDAGFTILIRVTGGIEEKLFWVRLNHRLLPRPQARSQVGPKVRPQVRSQFDGQWYETAVPEGSMRAGYNELSIWGSVESTSAENPIIIREIFVQTVYPV